MDSKNKVVVISDVHLGSLGSNAAALNHYLKYLDTEILIINGDFIDGWNFKKKYFPNAHFEVIRRVIKLIDKGTRVYYIAGNHDEFIRKYIGLSLGNFSIHNQLELNLNGRRHWFFHGDIFDASIQGRMKYLAKLGGKAYDILIWSNRVVNSFLEFIGKDRMSFSKKVKDSVKIAVKWVNDFEAVAADLAIENGYDTVVCGHIHTPQNKIVKTDKGSVQYLNSGDWVENNSSLEFNGKVWEIVFLADMAISNPSSFVEEDFSQAAVKNEDIVFDLLNISI
jgi:UDP-2,3-diacylglucosamine pyrophosphatase LpxH